jgi:hypothetical protein
MVLYPSVRAEALIDALLELSPQVRYAAVYPGSGEPVMRERSGVAVSSEAELDRLEEMLVNPTLVDLARRRGDIDRGGLDYLLNRYGNCFQLVFPLVRGHLSVSLDAEGEPLALVPAVVAVCQRHGLTR